IAQKRAAANRLRRYADRQAVGAADQVGGVGVPGVEVDGGKRGVNAGGGGVEPASKIGTGRGAHRRISTRSDIVPSPAPRSARFGSACLLAHAGGRKDSLRRCNGALS